MFVISSSGISGGAVAGIIIGALTPCCCIGICVVAVCIAIGSGAISSSNKSRNRHRNIPSVATATTSVVTTSPTAVQQTAQEAPRPYPTAPSVAPVPASITTTQPIQSQFQPSAPQEPPPPYPGTHNTYPVQPQPIGGVGGGPLQYSGYPLPPASVVQQGNAPYPSAPYYQLYAEAPPTNTVVASAPPPPQSAAMYQPPQQGMQLLLQLLIQLLLNLPCHRILQTYLVRVCTQMNLSTSPLFQEWLLSTWSLLLL